ncbi:hypothetical protein ACKWTF_001868 [Chironomus riparius]
MHRTPPKMDVDNNEVFSTPRNQPKPNVMHTPKNLFTFQCNSSETNPVNAPGSAKRGAENKAERSINDLYDTLITKFGTLSNELKEMRNGQCQFENKLDEKMDMLNNKMNMADEKLVAMDQKININEKRIDNGERAVNYLMQEKLMNRMEITGYESNSRNDKNTLLQEVIGIMRNHNIQFEADEINYVYKRTINKNKNGKVVQAPLIVVDFKNFETKVRVLKEKRSSNIKNGIFFDNCYTAANRSLMGKVKKTARDKNFKVYLNNNRIHVKKSDNQIHTVEVESDLNIIESWPPNKGTYKSNTNRASTSASTSAL